MEKSEKIMSSFFLIDICSNKVNNEYINTKWNHHLQGLLAYSQANKNNKLRRLKLYVRILYLRGEHTKEGDS